MKRILALSLACICFAGTIQAGTAKKKAAPQDLFPDGTPIPEWFKTTNPVNIDSLGKKYILTDFGILPDGSVHTAAIQAVIDKAAEEGGGVIVIPSGTYVTGGLDFKQGTHLYLEEGATLKGSEFIGDYPLRKTRMTGLTMMYFGALINADSIDGFTISGKGTIDGNGLHYHQAFWLHRKWKPKFDDLDEQRPRMIYISNCRNVQIEGVTLQNSAFWTTHFYNSENIKLLDLRITAFGDAHHEISGPSTDGVDLDVVKNVLIKGCYISVNDDDISLKGGKGPWADDPSKTEGNGGNENILIEDCRFGPETRSCLSLGSESIYDHNVLMRRCTAEGTIWFFRFKMRGDTPQRFEYVTIEDCSGKSGRFFTINLVLDPLDLQGRPDIPVSYGDHITMRNCNFECDTFFSVLRNDDYCRLSNFHYENLDIKCKNSGFHPEYVENFTIKNVNVELRARQ